MSRWDALKPDERKKESRVKIRGLPPPTSRITDNQDKISANKNEPLIQFHNAVQNYRRKPSDEALEDILQCFPYIINKLPAEEASVVVVQDVFIRCLEEATQCSKKQGVPNIILENILCTITDILKSKRHASALMAPFVDNNEHQYPNAVRIRLFHVLQELLSIPQYSKLASLCLVAAIQSARDIEGTEKHDGTNNTDISASAILKFVKPLLPTLSNDRYLKETEGALQLLLSFLLRHPDCSAACMTSLLASEAPVFQKCPSCNSVSNISFFNHLHTFGRFSDILIRCLVIMIENAPIRLWLDQGKRSSQQQSSFRQRIIEICRNVVLSTHCIVLRRWRILNTLDCQYLYCVFRRVPLLELDEKERSLSVETVELLVSICLKDFLPFAKRLEVAELLVNCMGGKMTPDGTMTNTCEPMALWIDSAYSVIFIARQIRGSKREKPIKFLLEGLFRRKPALVLNSSVHWNAFVASFEDPISVDDLSLIKALMNGREESFEKSFDADSAKVIKYILPFVRETMANGESSSRLICCSIYGSLLAPDWNALLTKGSIQNIQLLSNLSSTQALKIEALKALGGVCTRYFGVLQNLDYIDETIRSEMKCAFDHISKVVIEAAQDENGTVRTMALFAGGNLSQILGTVDATDIIDVTCIMELAHCFLNHTDDKNEKAVSNAVRATGLISHLLLAPWYVDDFSSISAGRNIYFVRCLSQFSKKILGAINVSQGQLLNLTWKQRNAAKKAAWGACNSTALLFQGGIAAVEDSDIRNACKKCLSILFLCLRLGEHIHGKIVGSASAAICSLDVQNLRMLTDDCSDLSELVVHLLLRLYNREYATSENDNVTEPSLFKHLLSSLSVVASERILISELMSTHHLLFLYKWMITNDIPRESFDAFALAMQCPGVMVHVEVEQKFSTKALDFLSYDEDNQDDEL